MMNEPALQLVDLVYQNYGRAGCGVALLLTLAVLALIFVLLNRLPESKIVTVWSKCQSCKYKRKESNVFILACPKHESPRWNQFRFPVCPRQNDFEAWEVIKNQSNPAFFHRDKLPENVIK